MKYKRKLITICHKAVLVATALLMILSVSAQSDSTFELSKTIYGQYDYFTVDNLGNYFLVDQQNQLKKRNTAGDSVGVFNDVKRYGKLYSIDATNPLKILLYYKDFNTVVMLDRFLNVINTVDLRKAGVFQARAIALSFDNAIWVYDELESKLKKINDDGSLMFESTDLRLALDSVPVPVKITDRNNFVYLYDPEKGLYTFDYYGTLKNKLPFLGLSDVQVLEKNMMGRRSRQLVVYRFGSLQLQEYELPRDFWGAEKVRINTNAVYVLKPEGVKCYRIK